MFMYTYLTSIWPCFYILVYILSGADVDASGAKGRTILFIAVLESSLNCMELLLKNGCKTNVRDNHGFTILKTIFKTNSIIKAEAIKLLQKFGQFVLLWYMHELWFLLSWKVMRHKKCHWDMQVNVYIRHTIKNKLSTSKYNAKKVCKLLFKNPIPTTFLKNIQFSIHFIMNSWRKHYMYIYFFIPTMCILCISFFKYSFVW